MERESRFGRWLRHFARSGPGGRTASSRSAAAQAEAARVRTALLLAAAAAGFPLAPAAHPSGYGCSCVRIGCPTPGRHPLSFGWQTQATTDAAQIERWAQSHPHANFVAATGRDHDVLDVPAAAGWAALERLESEGVPLGPVALSGGDRMLFFTATRGTPDDEDEWWPCELDCHPETMDEHPGLRWHCRGSYVLVPPATLPGTGESAEVRWVRPPGTGSDAVTADGDADANEEAAGTSAGATVDGTGALSSPATLPEPLTLLEALTDACAAHAGEETTAWPAR
ncbi:bifunctional DNA primase/polymerase [Streptomyces marispadix]|uniref:Bifunctional DNA primase/polymerase n=1 Tax=Streptomyces marispadix TaxID=2922868 RepID=A0ABS9SUS3_9ACTN|nr:bifunctional DNA primase/polymerase [Streptomyces marispadix]MCH6160017.1 bifunctional DNA primase/polymerase [Streptomyces marispadix]